MATKLTYGVMSLPAMLFLGYPLTYKRYVDNKLMAEEEYVYEL